MNVGAGFALVVILVAFIAYFATEKLWYYLGTAVVLTFALFGTLTFHAAPKDLGYGHVPNEAEAFTKRLDAGVAYQLLSSSKDGDDQVILVKKVGTPNFYALRVKEVPPEHFTLVDGKPVAIVPPAIPVSTK